MTQLLLPGEVRPTAWQKVKQTLAAFFQPGVYVALKNAETSSRNTSLMIASHQAIEESREKFRMKELQLQYVQFKEREANIAEQGQMNREFQAQQSEITRRFQSAMAELSHERQKELTEFRSKVDFALQEKNLDFQRWSLQQQRELQFELKTLDAELARELRAYDRETSMKLIEEKKKSDNSPIWLVASQIIGSNPIQEPIPLRVFFSPPVLPYDRMGKTPDSTRGFPEMADFLAEELRQFFGKYAAQSRPAEFIYGAWVSNFFHGEAASLSLFDALKTEPTLILESSAEGDVFNLRLGYWGLNCAKYRYQSFISGLSWREALNDFAKTRALKWYKRKQEWTEAGKSPEEFDKRYGAETVKRFMNNLEILEREQQCIEDGDDPNEIERPYYWHRQDYEDLKQFVAACHCLAAGLTADEYFLTDVPRHVRCRPLFPELLADVLKSVPEKEAGAMIDLVVSYYRNLYEYLAQTESCWIPELVLDLAQGLPDPSWSKAQIVFSVQEWLELHQTPHPGPLPEGEREIDELLDAMDSLLTTADVEYVEKLNGCLKAVGEDRSLNVAEACFRRAINRCRNTEYQAAISDFDQAVQLKPGWAEGFYNRGLTYSCLKQYQKAVEDYTESLRLSPNNADAFNNRANAYFRLGEHQKAIDDYDRALEIQPNLPEAEKNRAIVQGVLDEIVRKKAEDERRRKEEEARRREEEDRRRREEELRRREEERRRKEEEERKGKEFEFETVSVDSRGKIINRSRKIARQQVENLGNGVILEMVYIPGGTFTMGSPGNEADRSSDEKQHQVTVSPFFMGKYPVTQKQWEAVMGNNPSHFKGANRPVESVSWDDVQRFIEKLNLDSARLPVDERLPAAGERHPAAGERLPAAGERHPAAGERHPAVGERSRTYRLPTEAEWEYACRAGTTTPFYFGETITPDLVNYNGEYPYGSALKGKYRQQTTDVGDFPPNAFGLYDMHGNVWEWCHDWYGDYASGSVTDPIGPSSGSSRVARGGSWHYSARYCRSAHRIRYSAVNRGGNLGFRLVLPPGQQG